MSTVAKLLARKQALLERLESDPGPNERENIQTLLAQIETALNLPPVQAKSEAESPPVRAHSDRPAPRRISG
ncbi:hypothetical protein ACVIIV_005330 [Bradyrhizobium sp. USDA 4354]